MTTEHGVVRRLLPLLAPLLIAPLLLVACEPRTPDVAHCEPPARLVLAIAAITWPDSMYLVRWPDTLMVGQGVHLTPFCVASGVPITWIDARGHPIRPQPVGTAITVVPDTGSDTSRQ